MRFDCIAHTATNRVLWFFYSFSLARLQLFHYIAFPLWTHFFLLVSFSPGRLRYSFSLVSLWSGDFICTKWVIYFTVSRSLCLIAIHVMFIWHSSRTDKALTLRSFYHHSFIHLILLLNKRPSVFVSCDNQMLDQWLSVHSFIRYEPLEHFYFIRTHLDSHWSKAQWLGELQNVIILFTW